MNIQTHDAIGTSPYQLVFGEKLQTVLLPLGKCTQPILEEDIERDGIQIENNKHTIEMEEEYDKWKQEEEMVDRGTEDCRTRRWPYKGWKYQRRGLWKGLWHR